MHVSDLIISIAYFSIPVQILVSLWQYPRLALMPCSILLLVVLFAFFIFLCGAGHLLRCLEMADTTMFQMVNIATATISLVTALYLIPLVPSVMGKLDQTMDLKQLNREVTESKNKLFTFMAFLCHEIRNPLFAITSSATCCLEDTELTEEQAIAVGSIMDSSVLMLRLVNDVLDISKIDAGKLQLEEKTFDLHRMLDNLAHNIGRQVAQKSSQTGTTASSVHFDVIVGDNVPQLVSADPVRLLQIIYNLLSNALKFTQEGRIDLEITVCSHSEAVHAGLIKPTSTERDQMMDPTGEYGAISSDSNHGINTTGDAIVTTAAAMEDDPNVFQMALLDSVEAGHGQGPNTNGANQSVIFLKICVTDTGVGIAPDRLVNIFEPYSQAKLSDYREHGGTGLGLSIISGLTKAMGGKISVTSSVNVGSSFVLQTPIKVSAMPMDQAVSNGISQGDLKVGSLKGLLNDHPPLQLSSMRLPTDYQDAPASFSDFDAPATINMDDSSSSKAADSPMVTKGINGSLFGLNGSNGLNGESNGIFNIANATSLPNGRSKGTRDTASPSSAAQKATKPVRKKQKLEPLILPPNDNVVLIVDDNRVNQKIIANMLTHFEVEYRTASNGQEAVDFFLKESRNIQPNRADLPRFALVLMDLCMPIMGGFDAITELRKHGVTIPIVALTANALQQERDRAAAVGATDFQTKPILRKDLHALCKTYLQAHTQQ